MVGNEVYLYRKNRQALMSALDIYRGEEGKVLVPSYIPKVAVEPFKLKGWGIEYYRIKEDLGADLSDVKKRIDNKTRIVMGVNYGGFPNPSLKELKELCRRNDILFLEDNSQSSLSLYEGSLLGTFGDISINGFYKTMPVPAGAALYIDESVAAGKPAKADLVRFQAVKDLASNLLNLKSYFESPEHSIKKLNTSSETEEKEQDIQFRFYLKNGRLCHFNRLIMDWLNVEKIREKRRENYIYWKERMQTSMGLDPFYELSAGIAPTYMFFLSDREKIQRNLEVPVRGITRSLLPIEVKDNPDNYPEANKMAEKLCVIPVHTGLDPDF
jgi:dTDP-4-amino-4,6-dideoxygalactose transaminase